MSRSWFLLFPLLCLLQAGCRTPAQRTPAQARFTTNRAQIAAACKAVQAPDPATTAACNARPVLFEGDLVEDCLSHLSSLTSATDNALGYCLIRVKGQARNWHETTTPGR